MYCMFCIHVIEKEAKRKSKVSRIPHRKSIPFFQANKLLFTVDNVNFIDFFPNFLAFLLQSDAFLLNIKKI